MDCTVFICKKCETKNNQNILNKISISNEINEFEEDLSISFLDSGDSTTTDDSRFESNSYHTIDSDEVSDMLNYKETPC